MGAKASEIDKENRRTALQTMRAVRWPRCGAPCAGRRRAPLPGPSAAASATFCSELPSPRAAVRPLRVSVGPAPPHARPRTTPSHWRGSSPVSPMGWPRMACLFCAGETYMFPDSPLLPVMASGAGNTVPGRRRKFKETFLPPRAQQGLRVKDGLSPTGLPRVSLGSGRRETGSSSRAPPGCFLNKHSLCGWSTH